jgi:hypothetical protein
MSTSLQALQNHRLPPVLRELIELRALYEDGFADRIPNYDPISDKNFWFAITDFGDAIISPCSAVAPPK